VAKATCVFFPPRSEETGLLKIPHPSYVDVLLNSKKAALLIIAAFL
jgi:hypothetical protein